MEKEYRIRPYYKSELAEAYAPFLTTNSALNRLALWIDLNPQLSQALAQTPQPRCPSADEWKESCGTYIQWSITQPLKRIHLNQF